MSRLPRVNGTLLGIGVLLVALAFYLGSLLVRSWAVAQDGGLVGVLIAVGLVLVVAVGAWTVVLELRFGLATQRLGRLLPGQGSDAAGADGTGLDDLPRRPSGRVDRRRADEVFERRRAEVEADPADWRGWFRLALAYDAAGDRKRARAAARQAVRLERSGPA